MIENHDTLVHPYTVALTLSWFGGDVMVSWCHGVMVPEFSGVDEPGTGFDTE